MDNNNLKFSDVEIHYDTDRDLMGNGDKCKVIIDGKDFSKTTKSIKLDISAGQIPVVHLEIYADTIKTNGNLKAEIDESRD